jgi:microcystin-dependent protein
MQSRLNYKEYGAIKIYNKEIDNWTFIRPIKIGDIKQSVSQKDHNGWMICDGRSLNKIDYELLYNLIGTSFGGDEEEGTFNLPDARGRVPGSIGQGSGLTNRTMGSYIGSETHTMTINQMPTHSHGITDPGHSHSYTNNTDDQGVNTLTTQDSAADNGDLTASTQTSTTGITINNNGSGQAFNIMQPTLFIANTFIYALST